MSLLLPLGLLGLLAVAVLILIYIIRPNYQQKFISSTYVWKLSLKYRKKKIPINRLKNIILFICQLLILVTCAFLLARPVIPTQKVELATERVAIIDASASMMVEKDGVTRFDRAISGVREYAEETASENGVLSVILASDESQFVVQRFDASRLDEINEELDKLECTYASADIDAAVLLSEIVLKENPEAEVKLFTATEYLNTGKITVVDVSDESEWNVAVLGCTATLVDNYYEFAVKVGCYGGYPKEISVYCEVYNYNGQPDAVFKLPFKSESFDEFEPEKTVTFTRGDMKTGDSDSADYGIYSFEYVRVYVSEFDSLEGDNSFILYGGNRPVLKVQYASTNPNKFVRNAIQTMRESYRASWNIEFTEVRTGTTASTEGFDMYIFEHDCVPSRLPTDGFVMIIDPANVPAEAGFTVASEQEIGTSVSLSSGAPHKLTENISIEDITISKYRRLVQVDPEFDELISVAGDPILISKNTTDVKMLILAFDLHYSNIVLRIDFPRLFNNIFNYFMPQSIEKNAFEVGDVIDLNCRGISLTLKGPTIADINGLEFYEFPASFKVTEPGNYTLTLTDLRGQGIIEQFYVGISNYESNITKQVDALPALNIEVKHEQEDKDLLIYIAAALVALLFIEWWLQSREYF